MTSINEIIKQLILVLAIFIALAITLISQADAVGKFGAIFNVQGDSILITESGEIKLSNGKHLLRPIIEGDTITTSGNGRVLVVSFAKKMGFEIMPNTVAVIKTNGVVAKKGQVQEKAGFSMPNMGGSKILGATVLRSTVTTQCITIISPTRTSILTLQPELKWKNDCSTRNPIQVKILSGRKIIYEEQSKNNSLKIPEGILNYGKTYRWIVEDVASSNLVGGAFSIVPEDVFKEYITTYDAYVSDKDNITKRLVYIHYLINSDLSMQAKKEVKKLQADYPYNKNISLLMNY